MIMYKIIFLFVFSFDIWYLIKNQFQYSTIGVINQFYKKYVKVSNKEAFYKLLGGTYWYKKREFKSAHGLRNDLSFVFCL